MKWEGENRSTIGPLWNEKVDILNIPCSTNIAIRLQSGLPAPDKKSPPFNALGPFACRRYLNKGEQPESSESPLFLGGATEISWRLRQGSAKDASSWPGQLTSGSRPICQLKVGFKYLITLRMYVEHRKKGSVVVIMQMIITHFSCN